VLVCGFEARPAAIFTFAHGAMCADPAAVPQLPESALGLEKGPGERTLGRPGAETDLAGCSRERLAPLWNKTCNAHLPITQGNGDSGNNPDVPIAKAGWPSSLSRNHSPLSCVSVNLRVVGRHKIAIVTERVNG
jgi:hypothetical protein